MQFMNLGPYIIRDKHVAFKGNKAFRPLREVRGIRPQGDFITRSFTAQKRSKWFESLVRIWHGVFEAVNTFMEKEGAYLIDLPITTRMISSPGALTGTIPTDVKPFTVQFFKDNLFLTQSSQFYLELLIAHSGIRKVYCWEKSFRRERADHRHLPEFQHIEYEQRGTLQQILSVQERFLTCIVRSMLQKYRKDLSVFLAHDDLEELERLSRLKKFERISFGDAFKLLYDATGNRRYKTPSAKRFSVYEEVLITQLVGSPLFVTHYIGDEVAFYHENDPRNTIEVLNADLLYPGYGELIGCGERIHSRKGIRQKARHFKLHMEDYEPYINSRPAAGSSVHSGFGMGIERFIQCILKLPFIWDTKVFPRADGMKH